MLQSGAQDGSLALDASLPSRLQPSPAIKRLLIMLKDQCLPLDQGSITIVRCLIQGQQNQAYDACRAACLDNFNQKLDSNNIFIYLYPFTLFGHPYTDPRQHYGNVPPHQSVVVSAVKHISALLTQHLENVQLGKGEKSTYTGDLSVPSSSHESAELRQLMSPDVNDNELAEMVINVAFQFSILSRHLSKLASFIYTMRESRVKVTPQLLMMLFEKRRFQVIYHLVQYQDLSELPDPSKAEGMRKNDEEGQNNEDIIIEDEEKEEEFEQLLDNEELVDNPIRNELKDPIQLNYPFSNFSRALHSLIQDCLHKPAHALGSSKFKDKQEVLETQVTRAKNSSTAYDYNDAESDESQEAAILTIEQIYIFTVYIYETQIVKEKQDARRRDESIIRVWQHNGLETQAISLVLKLPELHSLEQYVTAILFEQFSMALMLSDRFNIFTEPLYKDFSMVILEKLLHNKEQMEVLLFLLKQNINYSLDFQSGCKLLNIFSQKLSQIVDPSSFMLNSLNSLKICVLLIEVLLNVKRLFGDLTTRCNYQIDQIKRIATHILFSQKDEDALRGQLFERDLEGREIINVICNNKIIELLDHESIEKFSRETWEGRLYLADTSIFRESTLYKVWDNDSADSNSGAVDIELLLRSRHLERIKCCKQDGKISSNEIHAVHFERNEDRSELHSGATPPPPAMPEIEEGEREIKVIPVRHQQDASFHSLLGSNVTPRGKEITAEVTRNVLKPQEEELSPLERERAEIQMRKSYGLQEHEAYRPLISLFTFTMWKNSTSLRYYQSHIAFFLIAVWLVASLFTLILQMHDLSDYGSTDYLGYLRQLKQVEQWRYNIFISILIIFFPIPLIQFIKISAYNCCFSRQASTNHPDSAPVKQHRKLYCEQLLKVYDEAFTLDWCLFFMTVLGYTFEYQLRPFADDVINSAENPNTTAQQAQTVSDAYERKFFDLHISIFLCIMIVLVLLRVFCSFKISRRLGGFIKVLKLSCKAFMTWIVLFAISLSMFSMMAVMLFLQKDGHKCQKSYKSCVMLFFAASLGEIDYSTMDNLLTAEILLTVFVITNMIMLLNILIAMLSNTYNNIVKKGKLYYEKELFDTWNHYRLDVYTEHTPGPLNSRNLRSKSKYIEGAGTSHSSDTAQDQLNLFSVLACVDFPLSYITTALFLLLGWLYPLFKCTGRRPALITEMLLYVPYLFFSFFSTLLFLLLEILLLVLAVPVAFTRKLHLVCQGSRDRRRWKKRRRDRCCELTSYCCCGFVVFSIFEIVMDTANFLASQLCLRERKFINQLQRLKKNRNQTAPREISLILRFADPPRVNILKCNVTIVLELCEKLERMGERHHRATRSSGQLDLNFTFEEIYRELKEMRKQKIAILRKDKRSGVGGGALQAKQRLRSESDQFESRAQNHRQNELIKFADGQLKTLLKVFVIQTENSVEIVNIHILHTVLRQKVLLKQVETKRAIAKPFYAEEALSKIEGNGSSSSKPHKSSVILNDSKHNDSLFGADSSITSQKPLVQDDTMLNKSEIEMSEQSFSPYISVPKARKQARVWADEDLDTAAVIDPVIRFLTEISDVTMQDFRGYNTQKILGSLRNYATEKEGYSNLSRIEVNLKMAREYLALVYEEKYGNYKRIDQEEAKLEPNLDSPLRVHSEEGKDEQRSEVRSEVLEPPTVSGYSPMELGFRDKFENVSNLRNFMTSVQERPGEVQYERDGPKSKVASLSELPPVSADEKRIPADEEIESVKPKEEEEEDDDMIVDPFATVSQADSANKMTRKKRFQ